MTPRLLRRALAAAFTGTERQAVASTPTRMSRQQWARAFGSLDDDTPQAAMQRADELFPTPAYRTLNEPYDEGMAAATERQWFTSDPRVAQSYVEHTRGAALKHAAPNSLPARLQLGRVLEVDGKGAFWNQLGGVRLPDDVAEILAKGVPNGRYSTNSIAEAAKRAGYDSVAFRNVRDARATSNLTPISDIYAVFRPENIRSRFAKFDRARVGENDLLAGFTGAIPATALATDAHRRRRRRVADAMEQA